MTVGDLGFLFLYGVLLGGGIMLGWGLRQVWQAPWLRVADDLASMARLVVGDASQPLHLTALQAVLEQYDYVRGNR